MAALRPHFKRGHGRHCKYKRHARGQVLELLARRLHGDLYRIGRDKMSTDSLWNYFIRAAFAPLPPYRIFLDSVILIVLLVALMVIIWRNRKEWDGQSEI